MKSPIPRPPTSCEVPAWARKNSSKMRFCWSAGIPMPRSRTEITTDLSDGATSMSTSPPGGEYRIALSTSRRTACSRRGRSADTATASGAFTTRRCWVAIGAAQRTTERSIAVSSTGVSVEHQPPERDARHFDQIVGQLLQSVRRALDGSQHWTLRRACVGPLAHVLGVSLDDGDRRLELVRQRGQHFALQTIEGHLLGHVRPARPRRCECDPRPASARS